MNRRQLLAGAAWLAGAGQARAAGLGQLGAGLGHLGLPRQAVPLPIVLQSVQRAGRAWTFTFQRYGSTGASRTDNYAVSGSSLNGNAAAASDFGGTFPSGTMTFAPGNATTTVTVTATDDVEPN